jgi:CheY-like chemotaxis protein
MSAGEAQQPCVVLVDDDLDDNFFHQRAIRRSGVAVTTEVYVDSTEALTRVLNRSEEPDLICVDLHMPNLDGWDFIRGYASARRHDGRPLAPVVVVTSSPDELTKRRVATSDDIVDLVAKPLTSDVFRQLAVDHLSWDVDS